jgi:hypothetical protein
MVENLLNHQIKKKISLVSKLSSLLLIRYLYAILALEGNSDIQDIYLSREIVFSNTIFKIEIITEIKTTSLIILKYCCDFNFILFIHLNN